MAPNTATFETLATRAVKFLPALFAIVLFTSAITFGQAPVAFVGEVEGVWSLNGGEQIMAGRLLMPGATIVRISRSSRDLIQIMRLEGGRINSASRICSERSCAGTIVVPRTSEPADVGAGIGGQIGLFFSRKILGTPNIKKSHENRGGLIRDGVLKLSDDGTVSVATLLEPGGEQYLSWRPHTADSDTGEWTKPELTHAPPRISGLGSGLYELQLSRRMGVGFEPLGSSLVLVVEPAKYDGMAASFSEAKAIVAGWGKSVRPGTKRLFLQSALEYLASK